MGIGSWLLISKPECEFQAGLHYDDEKSDYACTKIIKAKGAVSQIESTLLIDGQRPAAKEYIELSLTDREYLQPQHPQTLQTHLPELGSARPYIYQKYLGIIEYIDKPFCVSRLVKSGLYGKLHLGASLFSELFLNASSGRSIIEIALEVSGCSLTLCYNGDEANYIWDRTTKPMGDLLVCGFSYKF